MPHASPPPPRRGLSHPSLAEVVRAVERTTARLPVASPPAIAPEPAGACSTDRSSMDTEPNGGCAPAAASACPETSRPGDGKEEEEEDDDDDDDDAGHPYQDMSGGLEGMDASVLARRVEPIRRALWNVDPVGILGLDRSDPSGGARVSDVEFVRPIHGSIEPPRRRDADTCVRYLHITELDESYSMGVFIFPPNSTIPLHDHPGMCVLSRVLYGRLTVRSFDVIRKGDEDDEEEEEEEEEKGKEAKADSAATGIGDGHISNGGGGDCNGDHRAATDDLKRKSSFSWLTDSFGAGRDTAAATDPSSSSGNDGGGSGGRHRPKVPNRTGSWLSSLLFPYRRESSWLYRRQDSSSSSLGGGGNRKSRRAAASLRRGLPEGTLRAYRNPPRRVEAPHVQVLYPSAGNAHEFTAGPEGAAVLDVLLPPYDFNHDRDCTFYRVEADDGGNGAGDGGEDEGEDEDEDEAQDAKGGGNDGGSEGEAMEEEGKEEDGGGGVVEASTGSKAPARRQKRDRRGRPCWLVPTPQPKGFHCISGTYIDFGSDDDG